MATAGSPDPEAHDIYTHSESPPPNRLPPPPSSSPLQPPFADPPLGLTSADLLLFFREERAANRNALREQQEFMIHQQRQLLSALARQQPPTPNAPASPNQQGPRVRMADPPSFDGSIKETENFLRNIFDSQLSSFANAESKIRYALTFLTGGASNWRKLLLREVSEGRFLLNSWDAFETRFRETFGNPHLVAEARRKLWTIRQGQRTSEDFFLEFEEIRLEAGLCEETLIMFLQAALRPSLLDEVLRRDPQPTTYSDWKSASLRADHNQRNSHATRTFHSSGSLPNSSRRPNNFFNFRPRQTPQQTPPNLVPQQPNPPAQLKNVPQTSNTTTKPRNCWKCGKSDHISKDCVENSSNPKVRALLEQFDTIDAAFEVTSSGVEVIRRMLDSGTEVVEEDCRVLLDRFISEHPIFVEHDE